MGSQRSDAPIVRSPITIPFGISSRCMSERMPQSAAAQRTISTTISPASEQNSRNDCNYTPNVSGGPCCPRFVSHTSTCGRQTIAQAYSDRSMAASLQPA
jgi:hypothetical protein